MSFRRLTQVRRLRPSSTCDQSPALELDALREAGCDRTFIEKASGAQRDRPELSAALDYIRAGDTLVVWTLDRLAHSVRQLVEMAEDLQQRGIGLKVLTQQIDTTTPGAASCSTSSPPWPSSSAS